MKRKAIIIGLSGKFLTNNEKKILRLKVKPWGIILFKRNINSYKQIKNFIKSIRKITKDRNYPILIDEEGGSVSRLSKIMDLSKFSQNFFGDLYEKNKNLGEYLYKDYINQLSKVLKDLKININTVPVLDTQYKSTNNFLTTRIYSKKIKTIKRLGNICVNEYKKNKIATTIKHIPGHGLSKVDSHKKLPIVNKNLNYLMNYDFNCFKNINSLFAMTAHVLYKKLDKYNCATHSKLIIDKIIRKKINFKGIIISDDICMKALKKDLVSNAIKSIEAGCNIVLHCSGKYQEIRKLVKILPEIDDFTKKKTSEFYKFLS